MYASSPQTTFVCFTFLPSLRCSCVLPGATSVHPDATALQEFVDISQRFPSATEQCISYLWSGRCSSGCARSHPALTGPTLLDNYLGRLRVAAPSPSSAPSSSSGGPLASTRSIPLSACGCAVGSSRTRSVPALASLLCVDLDTRRCPQRRALPRLLQRVQRVPRHSPRSAALWCPSP
jgi:hypothetical protein